MGSKCPELATHNGSQELRENSFTGVGQECESNPVSKTKDLRKRAQKEKEESFMLPASSHPSSWNFSEPRRNFPSRKSCPHRDRKSREKEQLPQLLGYHTKVPLPRASKKWG